MREARQQVKVAILDSIHPVRQHQKMFFSGSIMILGNSPRGWWIKRVTWTKAKSLHHMRDSALLDSSPNVARYQSSSGVDLVRKCLVMFIVVLSFAGCNQGRSTDRLIEDLSSNDDADRIKAARFLQHRKGDASKVVPALIESLKDGDGDVRWSAAIGLGYFGAEAKSAIPALQELKSDKDRRIRDAARVAISRIEGKDE